ncbi:MAG: hypothetical protein ACKO3M_07865 [Rubrivivax sp.]
MNVPDTEAVARARGQCTGRERQRAIATDVGHAVHRFEVWAEDERRRIGEGRMARAIIVEAELAARACA